MVAGRGIEPLHLGYEPNQSTVTVPRKKKTGHLQLAEKQDRIRTGILDLIVATL